MERAAEEEQQLISSELSLRVLGDVDVATLVIRQCEKLPDIALLAQVNTACAAAGRSNAVWKERCQERWSPKWGFKQRWQNAEAAVANNSTTWRSLYHFAEADALRTSITEAELHSLVWDFRFWFRPESVVSSAFNLPSGLRVSQSDRVRFAPHTEPPDADIQHIMQHAELSGRVLGHPNGDEPLMQWLLLDGGRCIFWGYAPHLWPKGCFFRTPAWGWELQNPNVCLRAIDPDYVADGATTTEAAAGSSSADNTADAHAALWEDALASLVEKPIRATGDVITSWVEVSSTWLEHWGQ